MANNLSNKEQSVRDYIMAIMQNEFEDLDLTENSPFMEMFVLPQVRTLTPLMNYLDRMTLKQSLENASLMTETEMNEVAGRYFNERDNGERAEGYVIMVFSDIPSSGILTIPAGDQAISKNDHVFEVVRTHSFNENQLFNYYNPQTFEYRVPVLFRSVETGANMNIAAGEINRMERNFPNLKGIVNEVAFEGGRDGETNQELADRIKEEYHSANMGIERGYKSFLNQFQEMRENLIVGKDHPLMNRDLIRIVDRYDEDGNPIIKKVHWGNKVDIYVRGKRLEISQHFTDVKYDPDRELYYIPLEEVPVHDIVDVRLYDNSSQTSDPNIDDEAMYINDHVLERSEDKNLGTMNESSRLVIRDERATSQSIVRVRYRVNRLIGDIHESVYEEDNRPPTADIRLIESPRRYVFGSMTVQLTSPLGLRDREKNTIFRRSDEYVDSISMGGEFQSSELKRTIDNPSGTEVPLIDYFQTPSHFLVLDNHRVGLYDCLSEKKKETLSRLGDERFTLSEIIDEFRTDVTVYDFFDIVHVLTHEKGYDQAESELSGMNYEWGQLIGHISSVKEMFNKNVVLKRLNISRASVEQEKHWSLGDVFVYEDKDYSVEEWESNFLLLRNLAGLSEDDPDYNKLYRLVLYCITILFVNADNPKFTDDVSSLFRMVADVTKQTPIHSSIYY